MKYVSGLFALNLPCDLKTTGDWHTSALDWGRVKLSDSELSIFTDYGIERGRAIPDHKGKYNVANHIRAILDLMSEKRFDLISNFRNDFICNEAYREEFFRQAAKLLPDEEIADFMHRHYGRLWRQCIGWNPAKKVAVDVAWQEKHGEVMADFLKYLNGITDCFILKGETALAKCYGLDRFTEAIYLDGRGDQIISVCEKFCQEKDYSLRITENTNLVKMCLIDYRGPKPLKIKFSLRQREIPGEETAKINGIMTYTIDVMAGLKASAYQQRDKISDLYDLLFIINNYCDELESGTKRLLQIALTYKGPEYFDYIVHSQTAELMDLQALGRSFLRACEKLGLSITEEEKSLLLDSDTEGRADSDDFEG